MKEIVRFDVSVGKEHRTDWQSIARLIIEPLAPIGVRSAPAGLAMTFQFDRYPAGASEARRRLDAYDISSAVWVRREYNPTELLEAEFLVFGIENNVDSHPGTLHTRSVPLCSHCGFERTSWDLRTLRVDNEPDEVQIATVDWHPEVVSASLASQLKRSGFTGIDLTLLEEDSRWYAFKPRHILPPLQSPPTRLNRLSLATPLCTGEHNWKLPDSELFYRRGSFRALDFNLTYELFGDTFSSAPLIVVSNRVYRLFVELDVKGVVCEPIQLLSDKL